MTMQKLLVGLADRSDKCSFYFSRVKTIEGNAQGEEVLNYLSSPYENISQKLKLVMSTALATVIMAPVAYAQEAPEAITTETDDEIVVTGIRSALKEARDLKRNADTAVDSITASDVSTLPDLSVAEALARIPGVVAQKFDLTNANAGDFPSTEGGNNLIRGLAFVRSEFNGRETFSANGGRALDFGTVAPELIGSVNVYKNVTADITEGGIGGTIDLRTIEPFDKKGKFLTATVDGTYLDFRDTISPDLTVTAGNRWDGKRGEFGLLGSFAHSELDTRLDNFQLAQFAAVDDFELDPTNPFDVTSTGEHFLLPLGYQLRTNEIDRERQSYYVAGQWQNNEDTFKATAKYFRIENDINRVERTSEYFANAEQQIDGGTRIVGDLTTTPFTSSGVAQCSTITAGFPNDSCLEGNPGFGFRPVSGLYESGVISNSFRDWTDARGARHQNTAINTDSNSSTEDLSLNVQWRPADKWFVNVDAHKTRSEFQQQQLWGVTNFYSDFSFSGISNSGFPQITLVPDAGNNTFRRFRDGTVRGPDWTGATLAANPAAIPTDVSDPAANFLLSAADQFSENEGEAWAVKADVHREFEGDGWFDSIQFGARFSEREQTNQNAGLNWGSLSPAWAGEFGSTHLQVSEAQIDGEVVDYSDFFGGGVFAPDSQSQFVFVPSDLLADYDSFVNGIFTDPLLFVANGQTGIQNQVVNGGFVNPVTGETGVYSGSWVPLLQNGVVDYANRGSTNAVVEEVTALYGRLDFGNEFGNGSSLEGNIGLRYVKANVSGSGGIDYIPIALDPTDPNNLSNQFTPEAVAFLGQADVTQDGEFNSVEHWLPSVNVKYNLNDESLIRLAASKNITRPNISQLNPGRTRVAAQAFPTGDPDPVSGERMVIDVINTSINEFGGNPNLLPIESWNFDLGFEHYFGEDNYFSVTGFYKDISNNIATDVETLGFVTLDGDNVPILFIGDQNQDDATFTGVEVAYQHFFDDLPGLWSNFGLQANYTYIDADTNAPLAVVDANADGLPDSDERIFRFGVDNFLGTSAHTGNLVGIYQDDQFEFRLAYNYRSDFLVSYSDQITGNPIFVEGEGVLDGSAKWDINDHFQVRLQVSNILGNETVLFQQIDQAGQSFPRSTFKSDRRIKFGVRFQY